MGISSWAKYPQVRIPHCWPSVLTLNKLVNFYALVSPSGTWAYYDRSYLLGLLGGLDSTYNAPNTASGTRRALRPVTVKCHGTVPSTSPSCLKANAPNDAFRCVRYSVHRNLRPAQGNPCRSPTPIPTSRAHFSGAVLQLRGDGQPAGVAPGPAERGTTHLSRRSGPEQRPAAALALAVRTCSSASSGFRPCSCRHFKSPPVPLQCRVPMTQPAPASERSLGESAGPGLGAGMVAGGGGGEGALPSSACGSAWNPCTPGPGGAKNGEWVPNRLLSLGAESRAGVVRAHAARSCTRASGYIVSILPIWKSVPASGSFGKVRLGSLVPVCMCGLS